MYGATSTRERIARAAEHARTRPVGGSRSRVARRQGRVAPYLSLLVQAGGGRGHATTPEPIGRRAGIDRVTREPRSGDRRTLNQFFLFLACTMVHKALR